MGGEREKNKFISVVKELCELNGMYDVDDHDIAKLTASAMDHAEALIEYSEDYGFLVAESEIEDPRFYVDDYSAVCLFITLTLMAESQMRTMVENWGLPAEKYTFASDVADVLLKIFKNNFRIITEKGLKK